jgi:hypothetical protein
VTKVRDLHPTELVRFIMDGVKDYSPENKGLFYNSMLDELKQKTASI